MSPRPKKAPAAAAPKGRPIRRSQPRAVAAPRDASAPIIRAPRSTPSRWPACRRAR
jgi:hypothetical protein